MDGFVGNNVKEFPTNDIFKRWYLKVNPGMIWTNGFRTTLGSSCWKSNPHYSEPKVNLSLNGRVICYWKPTNPWMKY